MKIAFGPYRPDLAPLSNQDGMIRVKNSLPKAVGYRMLRGLTNVTGASGLTLRPRGSIAGTDSAGAGFRFSGDATKLYRAGDAGDTDVSRATGAYALGTKDRWDFAKMSDVVFASTYSDDMQFYQIGISTQFAPVVNAPRARHLAVVGDFLMAGNLYDPVDGVLTDWVSWSAYRNGLYWPTPDTDDAIAVQSDRQPLTGGGGWVQDVVGGAEVGLVFQERGSWRFDQVGGADGVFRVERVEQSIGMLVARSAVAFERNVFFIAEDGFRVHNYTNSENIGKDVLNRTFLADLDGGQLDRVWCAKDPDDTVIAVLYPGSGNVGGRPNKMIFWDYALNRFSHAEIDAEALVENVTQVPGSLDAPESLPSDPDDLGDPGFENPGGTSGYGTTSFDDRPTAEGSTRLGAYDTDFIASSFTGQPLEAILETGDLEFNGGQRALLTEVRPLVDDREASVSIGVSNRRGEPMQWGPYVGQDSDGKCPVFADGRYHRIRFKLPAGWNDAIGADVEVRAAGRF